MMEQQSRLSITVITMNRLRQVVEAIQSCLHCRLPDDTEFVVIDNASNDGTEEAVRVIHNPIANKWVWTMPENQELLLKGIAAPYAIKR